jgi:hypothetical protein
VHRLVFVVNAKLMRGSALWDVILWWMCVMSHAMDIIARLQEGHASNTQEEVRIEKKVFFWMFRPDHRYTYIRGQPSERGVWNQRDSWSYCVGRLTCPSMCPTWIIIRPLPIKVREAIRGREVLGICLLIDHITPCVIIATVNCCHLTVSGMVDKYQINQVPE